MSRERNPYFNYMSDTYNTERDMISVMINEAYNKFGVCFVYYVSTYDLKYDRIWGEDNNRRFIRNFNVNGYFTLPKEEKMWSKFGIEGMDDITLWISKRHFDWVSKDKINNEDFPRPRIGDVLRSEYENYYYEIVEVAEDTGNYLQSMQHLWELQLRVFKDENVSVDMSTSLSADHIADYTAKPSDIFDIRNYIDTHKEAVLYKPKPGETPKDDPFGAWS